MVIFVADNQMFQVSPDFDLQPIVAELARMYQAQGMSVNVAAIGQGFAVDFNNGNEGFNKYIGLGANIRANLIINNGVLYVNYTDADWSGKIVAFFIGWLLCWIPWVTCAVGIFKQLDLPNKIGNDIFMLVNRGGNSYGFDSGMYPQPNTTRPQNETAVCQSCGAGISAAARFCPECGAQTQQQL